MIAPEWLHRHRLRQNIALRLIDRFRRCRRPPRPGPSGASRAVALQGRQGAPLLECVEEPTEPGRSSGPASGVLPRGRSMAASARRGAGRSRGCERIAARFRWRCFRRIGRCRNWIARRLGPASGSEPSLSAALGRVTVGADVAGAAGPDLFRLELRPCSKRTDLAVAAARPWRAHIRLASHGLLCVRGLSVCCRSRRLRPWLHRSSPQALCAPRS